MRYACACALWIAAACGGKPSPAPRRPKPTPKPVAPEKPKPVVYDDASFVEGPAREHLVVSKAEDGWIFDSQVDLDASVAGGGVYAIHTVIDTDAAGAFASATIDGTITGGAGTAQPFHYAYARKGSDMIEADMNGRTLEFPGGDFFPTVGLAQLAYLCIAPEARTISVLGGAAEVTVGAAEAVGPATRAPVGTVDGNVELYCEDGRVLAVDGADPIVRDGADAAFAAVRRPAPEPPALPEGVTQAERTVSVEGDDDVEAVTLHCTLATPGGKKRAPAVAFVASSSKIDRDGDPANAEVHERRYVTQRIAYALAEEGIASLRCDARGFGGGSADVTVDTLVADATAILHALAREKGIDKKKLGYVGFEEAGTVAPDVWGAARPKALALVRPAGQNLGDQMIELAKALAAQQTDDPATIAAAEDAARRGVEAARAGQPLPSDAPAALVGLETVSPGYLHSFASYDPVAAAEAVQKTAVLLIDTTFPTDELVVERDIDALRTGGYGAATGKAQNDLDAVLLPKVDDDLRLRDPGDEGHRAPWWAPVSEDVIGDITAFFAGHL